MATTAAIADSLTSFHSLPQPTPRGRGACFNKASTTIMFRLSKKTRSVETWQSPTILHTNPPWDHALSASLNHFREDLPLSKNSLITEVQR